VRGGENAEGTFVASERAMKPDERNTYMARDGIMKLLSTTKSPR
jgi:hypothetical protein